jgi:hypothetical protein
MVIKVAVLSLQCLLYALSKSRALFEGASLARAGSAPSAEETLKSDSPRMIRSMKEETVQNVGGGTLASPAA